MSDGHLGGLSMQGGTERGTHFSELVTATLAPPEDVSSGNASNTPASPSGKKGRPVRTVRIADPTRKELSRQRASLLTNSYQDRFWWFESVSLLHRFVLCAARSRSADTAQHAMPLPRLATSLRAPKRSVDVRSGAA